MTGPVFVDTNVLVYARDQADPAKQAQAEAWLRRLWRDDVGRLSWQVLNEFYVTATQKLSPCLTREEARADVRDLLAWNPISVDGEVTRAAWRLQDAYPLSWWDALIVAAAQVSGCAYLLSEDMQAERNYGGVEVVNPFDRTPESMFTQR